MLALKKSTREEFDWITLVLYLLLVITGWLMIYAVEYDENSTLSILNFQTQSGKQSIIIFVSFIAMTAVYIIETKFWHTVAYPTYVFTLLLLIAVLFLGKDIKGTTSWFSLGGFSLQPSEFAKLGAALAMAAYLSYYKTDLKKTRYILLAFGIILVPAVLILLQPDAGSALVFFSFVLVMYRAGFYPLFYLIALSLTLLFVFSIVWGAGQLIMILLLGGILVCIYNLTRKAIYLLAWVLFGSVNALALLNGWLMPAIIADILLLVTLLFLLFKSRKEQVLVLVSIVMIVSSIFAYSSRFAFDNLLAKHQQDRINVWLRPDLCDPYGSLYNVLQSKMAIGSGGVAGKGFLNGTLTKLNYVPEQSTDFIFCTIGEEQGFFGVAGLIVIFLLLFFRMINKAEKMRTQFARNFTYGIVGILFVHFFINIAMTMGLMPIIGIPLPFISAGGSSLLGFSMMIGIFLRMSGSRNA
jgi:rod shape determining protein RodA